MEGFFYHKGAGKDEMIIQGDHRWEKAKEESNCYNKEKTI
jgi:hypothetical protein